MNVARQSMRALLAAGLLCIPALPASAFSLVERLAPEVKGLEVGYERGAGSESFASQGVTADHPQIDRFYARLKGQLDPELGLWLNFTRGAYQFEDRDFPGTAHLRHETRLVAGLSRDGDALGGSLRLGAGYGLDFLQVKNSANLSDSEPAFFFLPWQALHGVILSESFRVVLGPVGLAVDGEWSPFLFAHLADARLALPGYVTTLRVAPRLSLWNDRLSLGYAYERTLGTGFDRQSGGPFMALTITGI